MTGPGGVFSAHTQSQAVIDAAKQWFLRMEGTMRQWFQYYTRFVAFIWVVAFLFQVSTAKLLAQFSADPVYRANAVVVAERQLAQYDAKLAADTAKGF